MGGAVSVDHLQKERFKPLGASDLTPEAAKEEVGLMMIQMINCWWQRH